MSHTLLTCCSLLPFPHLFPYLISYSLIYVISFLPCCNVAVAGGNKSVLKHPSSTVPVVVQPLPCSALMKTHVMPSCTNRHDNPAGTRQRRNERWGEGGRLIDLDREKEVKTARKKSEDLRRRGKSDKEEKGRLTVGEGKLRNKGCRDRGESRKSKDLRLKSEIQQSCTLNWVFPLVCWPFSSCLKKPNTFALLLRGIKAPAGWIISYLSVGFFKLPPPSPLESKT